MQSDSVKSATIEPQREAPVRWSALASPKFKFGDWVATTKGSSWHGRIVGMYSTALTREGYAVESSYEQGSVQIYPASALELWAGNSPTERNHHGTV